MIRLKASMIFSAPKMRNKTSFIDANTTQLYETNSTQFFRRKYKINEQSFYWKNIALPESFLPTKMYYSLVLHPITAHFGFNLKHHIGVGEICRNPNVTRVFNVSRRCNVIVDDKEYQLFRNGIFWAEISANGTAYYASVCDDKSFFLQSSCKQSFVQHFHVRYR